MAAIVFYPPLSWYSKHCSHTNPFNYPFRFFGIKSKAVLFYDDYQVVRHLAEASTTVAWSAYASSERAQGGLKGKMAPSSDAHPYSEVLFYLAYI